PPGPGGGRPRCDVRPWSGHGIRVCPVARRAEAPTDRRFSALAGPERTARDPPRPLNGMTVSIHVRVAVLGLQLEHVTCMDTEGICIMERTTSRREPLRLLTTVEAAEALALSPRTLEMYRLRGTGPRFVRIGSSPRGAVRYRESDL